MQKVQTGKPTFFNRIFYQTSSHCNISILESEEHIKELVKFWTGWHILPNKLSLQYSIEMRFKASTCFEMLIISLGFNDFKTLQ